MRKLLGVVAIVAVVLDVSCGTGFAQGNNDGIKLHLPVKWSQWVDLDNGYDVYSFWQAGNPGPTTVVADDWRCPDGRPVTDVHWWGSYIGGDPQGLLGFEISIHADIPPDDLHPSHPGDLLYSFQVFRQGFQEQFFGVSGQEDVYQYNAFLPEPFEQEQGVIYWLNIIALVDNETVWGWHTGVRPQPDNTLDDAVMIFDYNPETGGYLTYIELYDAQGSVAMAFELTTIPEPGTLTLVALAGLAVLGFRRRRSRRLVMLLMIAATMTIGGTLYAPPFVINGNYGPPFIIVDHELPLIPLPVLKWIQPPDLDNGRDIYSFWPSVSNYPIAVVADDWRCLDGLPIADIHWWGSYPSGKPAAAPGVLSFEVSIHADIPAAGDVPSHPGALLWSNQYLLGTQVVETLYAADNDGEDVYRYDLLLPEPDWFYQEQDTIYWLNIVARTNEDVVWGWHTAQRPAPENGLDAAVTIFDYNPSTGSYTRWGALYDVCQVQMAFALTTVPEPASLALVGTGVLMVAGILRRRGMHR